MDWILLQHPLLSQAEVACMDKLENLLHNASHFLNMAITIVRGLVPVAPIGKAEHSDKWYDRYLLSSTGSGNCRHLPSGSQPVWLYPLQGRWRDWDSKLSFIPWTAVSPEGKYDTY